MRYRFYPLNVFRGDITCEEDHVGEDEDGDEPKALQFAKMDVPPEYMLGKDEELILSMEEVGGVSRYTIHRATSKRKVQKVVCVAEI